MSKDDELIAGGLLQLAASTDRFVLRNISNSTDVM